MNGILDRFRVVRGRRDYKLQNQKTFYPWGFAMNGMTSRLEATRQIIFAANIERIVETGTFRGTTTEWFAQFGLPVESVEIAPRLHAFSEARLKNSANAEIINNSSVPFLKDRVSRGHISRNARQLFYLDAHWENHFPLREELEIIFNHYTHAIVLIDDFQVDDDAGYAFDDYGADRAATLDYVKASNLPPLDVFYPTTPSKEETGARCGWVVLSSNLDVSEKLAKVQLLRKYKG